MAVETPQQAWSRGFDDAVRGIPVSKNPYPNGKLRLEWKQGHAEGLIPDPDRKPREPS